MSAIRSSTDSRPMDSRMTSSPAPHALRCSAVSCRSTTARCASWRVMHGTARRTPCQCSVLCVVGMTRVHWLAPNGVIRHGVIRQHIGAPCGSRRHRHPHTDTRLALGPQHMAKRSRQDRRRKDTARAACAHPRACKCAHPCSRTHTSGARPRAQSRCRAPLLSGRCAASGQDATCKQDHNMRQPCNAQPNGSRLAVRGGGRMQHK